MGGARHLIGIVLGIDHIPHELSSLHNIFISQLVVNVLPYHLTIMQFSPWVRQMRYAILFLHLPKTGIIRAGGFMVAKDDLV